MTIQYQNYIDGAFSSAAELADVENPATEEIIGQVPRSTPEDVNTAVAAAHKAQPEWARLAPVQRAAFLRKISAALRERVDFFADLIVREQGKTQELAKVEASTTAEYFEYMAEWARRIEGEIIPSDRPNETIMLTYKPIGVVGAIMPWNFPFFLIARKMAPALLTGNTIVMKPAEATPMGAFEFAKLVDEIGLPAGVFNLVGGRGSVVGEAIINHPDVDLITFTGSVATGKHIMSAAGQNLTRVSLELGGKAPAIVLADADLDLAARSIWSSRVINTGQVCNCAEKVLVEASVHDALVEKLQALFEGTKYGDPSQIAELDMGPLIDASSLERVAGVVETAKSQGATVVTGGSTGGAERGHYFEPTLLTDVTKDMNVMKEETFGPVLPVMAVADLDEALAIANDSEFGLTSSVYTNNLNKALRAVRELEYGETYINRENFEAIQGFHAGRKHSGIGGDDGKHGVMEFLESHIVYIEGQPA